MTKLLLDELVRKIAFEDDMNSYEELYHSMFSSLFSIAFSIVKNRETAEEIVSDVFLKIWQLRKKLAATEEVQLYIFRMARNQALTEITKWDNKRTVDISTVQEEPFLFLDNPEHKLISSELQARLTLAIQQLPAQCQLIFQLVKEEGLRYKQVAEILDLSVNTVRNQLSIAIKKLYEQLAEK
jgi:RNA polymerase sigma-70 factor (ECF subfamily)